MNPQLAPSQGFGSVIPRSEIGRQEEEKEMPTRFVITGCGRSGTGYLAKLLEGLGCPCGHEALFNPARLGWTNSSLAAQVSYKVNRPLGGRAFLTPEEFWEHCDDFWPDQIPGESSWLAVPYLSCLPQGTIVLHQVRDPIPVVRSLVRVKLFQRPRSPYTVFAEEFCEALRHGNPIERSIHYWLEWNRMAEQARLLPGLRYFRYRLEDIDEGLVEEILLAIGFQCSREQIQEALKTQPSDYNSRGSRENDSKITWLTLPAGYARRRLEEQAQTYGYLPDQRVW
jgi:hypothetical protein